MITMLKVTMDAPILAFLKNTGHAPTPQNPFAQKFAEMEFSLVPKHAMTETSRITTDVQILVDPQSKDSLATQISLLNARLFVETES